MRTTFPALLVLALSASAAANPAHDAQIDDPDGYTNLRAEPKGSSKIVGKIKKGETFTVGVSDKSKWWLVRKDGAFAGFIHKSRVAVHESAPYGVLFGAKTSKGVVRVWISDGPFKKKNHEIQYYKSEPNIVEKIDGAVPKGTDGNLPQREITEFEVEIGKKKVKIDSALYKDCFEPDFERIKILSSRRGARIKMDASDGAGAYTVTWTISRTGKVKRKIHDPN